MLSLGLDHMVKILLLYKIKLQTSKIIGICFISEFDVNSWFVNLMKITYILFTLLL